MLARAPSWDDRPVPDPVSSASSAGTGEGRLGPGESPPGEDVGPLLWKVMLRLLPLIVGLPFLLSGQDLLEADGRGEDELGE